MRSLLALCSEALTPSSLNMLSACPSVRVMRGFLVSCWASVTFVYGRGGEKLQAV